MGAGNKRTGFEYQFVILIDELLRKRNDFISYHDVFLAFDQENPSYISDLDRGKYYDNVLTNKYQSPARKAKSVIGKLLKEKNTDFVTKKQGKISYFKYPDNMKWDILESYRKETKQIRFKSLYELINKSKGILPSHLLAKFQIQAEEEIGEYNEGDKIIEFDSNPLLKNFELLPNIYQAIKNRQVITFDYKPYGGTKATKIIHPHYLKEYNSRWFLFGKEDMGKDCNLAIDRIVSDIKVVESVTYRSSSINYSTYFDNIVGVTHYNNRKKIHIIIKTFDLYTYERIITKPIHKSQTEMAPFAVGGDRESYGMISIDVIPNFELLGLLMTFENHIEIVEPVEYRDYFKKEIDKMYKRYIKK